MTKSSPLIWCLLHSVKLTVKILSIFVAFLENMNFNKKNMKLSHIYLAVFQNKKVLKLLFTCWQNVREGRILRSFHAHGLGREVTLFSSLVGSVWISIVSITSYDSISDFSSLIWRVFSYFLTISSEGSTKLGNLMRYSTSKTTPCSWIGWFWYLGPGLNTVQDFLRMLGMKTHTYLCI